MPTFDLEARPEAVPAARGLVRELLDLWGEQDLRDDVDLVLSELLGNVVLHAPGPARLVVDRAEDGVRLEVRDASPVPPRRRSSGEAATTGRGLNLVAALTTGWGVAAREDRRPGKAVWCVVPRVAGEEVVPDIDVDALLAAYDDDDLGEAVEHARQHDPAALTVHVGEAPVALLLAAKDHLDGVLRELALAEGAGGLPLEVVEQMGRAVRAFADARTASCGRC